MSEIGQSSETVQVSASELAELRRKAEVADWIFKSNTVECGWHENPENHTLSVTLFFGSFDPRHLVRRDAHGHARLEIKDIEEVVEYYASLQNFRRKSRKQLSGLGKS